MTTKTISRKTRGAIAAIAGGALLLGTGATFALWSDSLAVSGNTVATGHLRLNEAAASWTYTGLGTEGEVGAGFLMVPGHVVTGSNLVVPQLSGTDLTATLTTAGGDLASDAPLVITWKLGTLTQTGTNVTFAGLTPETTGPLSVQIEFAPAHTPDLGMDTAIDLSGLTVTLTQTTP